MDQATKKLILEAVELSAYDPAYFLRFFLTHWFPSTIPPVHLGIIAIVTKKVKFLDKYPEAHDFLLKYFLYEPDARDKTAEPVHVFYLNENGEMCMRMNDNANVIMPRGFSKTTLLKGVSVYDALTDPTLFEVFISETATHSETQVNDIKVELETNAKIRAAYGDQVPTKAESEKWTAKELQLRNGAIITSRGRGGQVRGMTYQGRRPNKIILDDVEDDESVKTDTQRKKTKEWFYAAVVPAGQMMEGARDEEWAQEPLQIVNLGTLLGPECLVRTLTGDTDFGSIRFGAVADEKADLMLWDYKMPREKYDAMREKFRRVGALSQFTREYDSLIRVDEDAVFPEVFIYQPTTRADLIHVAQALDPAISDAESADHAALVVSGRRKKDGALWFLDEWGGIGKTPTEKLDAFFEYHHKWKCTHNGIEAIAYQAALITLAQERMSQEKYFFNIEAIRHGGKQSKEARVVGMLSPRYGNGYLRHLRPLPGLEGNLADWPLGKRDYADAGAMSLSLLGETAGLMMDGALQDLPTVNEELPPEAHITVGNYMVRRANDPVKAGRYG